jgi:hypothetical protein
MTLPKRGDDGRYGPEEGASCLSRIPRRHIPFGVEVEGEVAIAYEGGEREREREICERMIKTTHLSGRGNGRARTCRHRKELLAVRCLDPHSLFLDHLLLPVD